MEGSCSHFLVDLPIKEPVTVACWLPFLLSQHKIIIYGMTLNLRTVSLFTDCSTCIYTTGNNLFAQN